MLNKSLCALVFVVVALPAGATSAGESAKHSAASIQHSAEAVGHLFRTGGSLLSVASSVPLEFSRALAGNGKTAATPVTDPGFDSIADAKRSALPISAEVPTALVPPGEALKSLGE